MLSMFATTNICGWKKCNDMNQTSQHFNRNKRNGNTGRKSILWPWVLFLVLSLSLIVYTTFDCRSLQKSVRVESFNRLENTAQVSVNRIVNWKEDEYFDARALSQNIFLIEHIDKWLTSGKESDKLRLSTLMQNLKEEHCYENISLVEKSGKVLLSLNDETSVPEIVSEILSTDIKPDSVVCTNAYTSEKGSIVSFASPLSASKDTDLVLVFDFMIRNSLLKNIDKTYLPDSSFDVFLVQNINNSISMVCGDSIKLVASNKDEDQIENKASNNYTGRAEGFNNNRDKDIAYIHHIPDTQWYIIAQISEENIVEILRSPFMRILLLSLLFILMIAFAAAFTNSRHERNFYKKLWLLMEEFKATLYSIGDGMISTDSNGYITKMNKIAENLTGWKESEARNKPLNEVFFLTEENTKQPITDSLIQTIKQGIEIPYNEAVLLVARDGRKTYISNKGMLIKSDDNRIVGIVMTFCDQTIIRKQKEEIEENRRQMTTLMSNLPGMAYRCKNDNYRTMLFVSNGCSDLVGYRSDELINNKRIAFGEIIDPSSRSLVQQTTNEAIKNKEHFQLEYPIITRDGTTKWVWEHGLGIFNNRGEVVCIEGFISDITALRNAEEEKLKLANILQSSNNELFMFDEHTLKFVYANAGALNNLGYDLDEITKMTPSDIKPRQVNDSFDLLVMRLRNGSHDIQVYETVHQRKDYSEYPVEVHLQLLKQDDKSLFLAVAIDITERKMNEEALKQSEEEYRNLFERHSAVKLMFDPHNGQIMNANFAASKFYGWTREQLLKMTINDISLSGMDDLRTEVYSIRNNQNNHFEFKHKLSDGSIRYVKIYSCLVEFGRKLVLHSIIHDITERKNAERQIKILSQAIEQSPVSVIITNTNGDIEYANQEFLDNTGFTIDEIRGENPRFLKSGTHEDAFYKNMWETITSGKNWQGNLYNKKKNGEFYWDSTIIIPIAENNGEITHFVALKEDITKERKMISELVLARQKAEESEKLKTAFLANISHEIRTPLNAILGFSKMFTGSENITQKQKDHYLHMMTKGSDTLLQTVNDILDLSGLETGQVSLTKKQFDINLTLDKIYRQTLKMQHDFNKDKLEIRLITTDKPVMINGDEQRVIQIFLKLINNALKFTTQGYVHFGVCNVENEKVELFVEDTGIGINEKDQKIIFDHFRQLDDATTRSLGGNGTGLSIVKRLIELMDGDITVTSKLGKGAMFRFTIQKY